MAAAVVTGGRVRVPGWPRRADQPGDRLPELLARMGATCVLDGDGLTTTAGDRLDGLDADLADCTELVPALVALAALARTPSTFRGIGHMRGHETDRLAALRHRADQARRRGDRDRGRAAHRARGRCTAAPSGRTATTGSPCSAPCSASPWTASRSQDVATTGKTVPDFVDRWTRMLGATPAAVAP